MTLRAQMRKRMNAFMLHNGTFRRFFPNTLILANTLVCTHVHRDFTMWRLWSTKTVKHATAHDQYYVTVHFSCVVPGLRWVVEMFRVVATAEKIFLVFCAFRLYLGPYYRNNEKLFGERSVKCAYFFHFFPLNKRMKFC